MKTICFLTFLKRILAFIKTFIENYGHKKDVIEEILARIDQKESKKYSFLTFFFIFCYISDPSAYFEMRERVYFRAMIITQFFLKLLLYLFWVSPGDVTILCFTCVAIDIVILVMLWEFLRYLNPCEHTSMNTKMEKKFRNQYENLRRNIFCISSVTSSSLEKEEVKIFHLPNINRHIMYIIVSFVLISVFPLSCIYIFAPYKLFISFKSMTYIFYVQASFVVSFYLWDLVVQFSIRPNAIFKRSFKLLTFHHGLTTLWFILVATQLTPFSKSQYFPYGVSYSIFGLSFAAVFEDISGSQFHCGSLSQRLSKDNWIFLLRLSHMIYVFSAHILVWISFVYITIYHQSIFRKSILPVQVFHYFGTIYYQCQFSILLVQ